MKKLKIYMENCYGIGKLDYEFDFSDEQRVYSIYAPNGTMKTSFAKAFCDIMDEEKSKDLVSPDSDTSRRVKRDDEEKEVEAESVFVVMSYDETYQSKKISTLLANEKLKNDYEEAHRNINEEKARLIEKLSVSSGLSKEDIENEISKRFVSKEGEFFTALGRIDQEVRDDTLKGLSHIIYNEIFSDKTEKFLSQSNIRKAISEYIEKYNHLIDNSKFFTKGVFNHYNAESIAKDLKKNGFFKTDHYVVFTSSTGEKEEIDSEEKLRDAIETEKNRILGDPALLKIFNGVDKQLDKNTELRDFREYLSNNEEILSRLDNLDYFKNDLWISYIQEHKDIYESLMVLYKKEKAKIDRIVEQAKEETSKWEKVIEIYNHRFSVPFTVKIENQSDAILLDKTPHIAFEYNHAESKTPIKREDLINLLSAGELRALYIMNIIFEIEARKESNQETLFIIDDITDSFDYKNKYAILEYLDDISKKDNFYQIILTHNFDFYRTMNERLDMLSAKRSSRAKLHVVRAGDGSISLHEDRYSKNPFDKWKKNLGKNDNQLIAFISFARNIAEFSGDDDNKKKLTSCLHFKDDTPDITVSILQEIFKDIFKGFQNLNLPDGDKKIISLIHKTAEDICSNEGETGDLEQKIALSIAIRLKTEEFIIKKLEGDPFIDTITANQTRKLVERYKEKFPNPSHATILDEVNLMTPQNIHINSFMYEPIIDMSIVPLRDLYKDVCGMGENK